MVVLRLSNFDLMLVHCGFHGRTPLEVVSAQDLLSKKFRYAFHRVYLKQARLPPNLDSTRFMEAGLGEALADRTSFSNIEMATFLLTRLEVIPMKFAIDMPKLGRLTRRLHRDEGGARAAVPPRETAQHLTLRPPLLIHP